MVLQQNNKKLNKAIVKTLCYAQIFSFPLTPSELWQYLISDKYVQKDAFFSYLEKGSKIFHTEKGYIVLSKDEKLVDTRMRRSIESRKKYAKARFISHVLSYIPTIKLIGVTGSLSVSNAKKEDDIDLFFITSKKRLWLSRLFIHIVLTLLGEKRKRGNSFAQDEICPNMFLSENSLQVKRQDRSMYVAHEIVQMKPLFSKDNMYEKFLFQNKWVLEFLPNAFVVKKLSNKKEHQVLLPTKIGDLVENIAYSLQYFYMKKRITNEKISRSVAAFHPLKQKEAINELYTLKTAYYLKSTKSAKKAKLASNFTLLN